MKSGLREENHNVYGHIYKCLTINLERVLFHIFSLKRQLFLLYFPENNGIIIKDNPLNFTLPIWKQIHKFCLYFIFSSTNCAPI